VLSSFAISVAVSIVVLQSAQTLILRHPGHLFGCGPGRRGNRGGRRRRRHAGDVLNLCFAWPRFCIVQLLYAVAVFLYGDPTCKTMR